MKGNVEFSRSIRDREVLDVLIHVGKNINGGLPRRKKLLEDWLQNLHPAFTYLGSSVSLPESSIQTGLKSLVVIEPK